TEAGGDECVHQVKLPDLHTMFERENSHGDDDRGAHTVEPHDQDAAVFTINEDAGEGKHQHGGDGLQNGKGAEGHFRVRGLEDVPGYCGRVHAAAQHGDHVGGENETQRSLAEDGAHTLL